MTKHHTENLCLFYHVYGLIHVKTDTNILEPNRVPETKFIPEPCYVQW